VLSVVGGQPAWSTLALAATTSRTSHSFFSSYSASTGAFGQSQPAVADLSDTPNANYVLAGPTTGSAATATFRALVPADIPQHAHMFSYLPNLKYASGPTTFVAQFANNHCDVYTVPAGRRALIASWAFQMNPGQTNSNSCTSIANASGGTTVYTGTTGGSGNAYLGYIYKVVGCTNAANNGAFYCTASTNTSVTLANPNGVAETPPNNNELMSGSSYIYLQPTIKVNGNYYTLDYPSGFLTPGTSQSFSWQGLPYIAEAGETFSFQVIGYQPSYPGATTFTVLPLILEFDNTSSIRSSKVLGPLTGNILYTPAGSMNGAILSAGAVASIFGTSLSTNYWGNCAAMYNQNSAAMLINGQNYLHGTSSVALTQVAQPPASMSLTSCGSFGSLGAALNVISGDQICGGFIFNGYANDLIGQNVTLAGYNNASNNGTYFCVSTSTATSPNSGGFTVLNTAAVTEIHGSVFILSSIANASGGSTVYTGTISGGGGPVTTGASNAFANTQFTISGCVNAVNNGTFTCTASTATSITLSNASGVAETVTTACASAGTAFVLTAVATSSGGSTTYTGTITSGGTTAYTGQTFTITGFTNTQNNGSFVCTASSSTTLTLSNAIATAETHAGLASAPPCVATVTTNTSQPGLPATNTNVTIYHGTITGGAANAYAGQMFTIAGFNNSQNNGTFLCTASTASTLTLANGISVWESNGSATAVSQSSVYTGTFPYYSAQQNYIGFPITVTGFTNAGNNGTFTCTGGSATTVILTNPSALNETHAATAATYAPPFTNNKLGAGGVSVSAKSSGSFLGICPTIFNGDHLYVNCANPNSQGVMWCNVMEF
jgi:hypothetical protein